MEIGVISYEREVSVREEVAFARIFVTLHAYVQDLSHEHDFIKQAGRRFSHTRKESAS